MPKLSSSVISATRVHFPVGTTELPQVAVENLKKYAISTRALGIVGAIAVNCLEDRVQEIVSEAAPDGEVIVLHVPVWGAFVAALNTLLGEAQRRKARFVLFQSLEVVCPPSVLRKMLDHFTSRTLVVGPELDGHIFQSGEQPLTGRSTPWNTLSLWSTRKLGLTGFLSIADGVPDRAKLQRQLSGELGVTKTMTEATQWGADPEPEALDPDSPTMGSAAWWERQASDVGLVGRQATIKGAIPAGVEEVTAIALIQHLLGEANARAVLLHLSDMVSWKTDWAGDEKRRQWHEYKMNTKITRPAAQIKQLFGKKNQLKAPSLPKFGNGTGSSWKIGLPWGATPEEDACVKEQDSADSEVAFGTVWHFDESVRPPLQVERICCACVALFLATFASSFAAAFQTLNSQATGQYSTSDVTFIGLLLGGIYIPMPLSLYLTRWLTSTFDQKAGLVFFAGTLLFAHTSVALFEADGHPGQGQRMFLICMRLLAGLGAGMLFQTRFILLSTSTQDHHHDLLSRTILSGDLGLAIGALLPYLSSIVTGDENLSVKRPEMLSSIFMALASLALLLWILCAFPAKLYRLPSAVRFAAQAPAEAKNPKAVETADTSSERHADGHACAGLLASGTLYVSVQSAALISLALWMREAQLTGSFRQTKAVAALFCLPAIFEALASGLYCRSMLPKLQKHSKAIAIALVGVVVRVFVASQAAVDEKARVAYIGLGLSLLLLASAFVGPFKLRHARVEDSLAALEWLKAYVGRLAAPILALAIQHTFGYVPLLGTLCCATVIIALVT